MKTKLCFSRGERGSKRSSSRPLTLDKDVLGHLGAHVGVTLLLRDEHTCPRQAATKPGSEHNKSSQVKSSQVKSSGTEEESRQFSTHTE